jgi:hypothetical protein
VKSQTVVLCLLLVAAGLHTTREASADPVPPPARLPVCGDQDGSETPFVMSCPELSQLVDVQTFTATGSGDIEITFDFAFRRAGLNNELGFFLIDNADGSVDGLRPGDAGYLQAVNRRAEIIFPSGSDPSAADVAKSVPGESILVFFLVSDATLADFMATNPENSADGTPPMFFSWDALNPDSFDHFVGYQHATEDYIQFGFEDLLGGGDVDYDDVVYNVSALETGAQIGPTAAEDGGGDVTPVLIAAALALLVLSAGGGALWFRRRSAVRGGAAVLATRARGPSEPLIWGGRPAPAIPRVDAWLEVGSEDDGERYPLGDEPVTVGFTGDCSINLARGGPVSAERIRIWRREGAYMLHNLARGRVAVAGRPAAAWTVLEDGDEIELGDRRLMFRTVNTPGNR